MGSQLLFMPLRDGSGVAQLVFSDPKLITQAQQLRQESVVCVEGTVRLRPQDNINPHMATGKVEVVIDQIHLLNAAPERLPFLPLDKAVQQASDELRGRYRYLDLRRPEMQRNIRKRSAVAQTVRSVLNDEGTDFSCSLNIIGAYHAGFVEIETPLLFKSTPEGAREFLVPSRKSPGAFYALPQSPQQVRRLHMSSMIKCKL
jgi:aspartyl-tRNA synthetase